MSVDSTVVTPPGDPAAELVDAGAACSEPAAAESAPGLAELQSALESLRAERDRLSTEKADLQDLLLRRQADYDNFRKRVERDRAEMAEYAAMDAVRALLPVLDDFERAIRQPSVEAGANGLGEYLKGFQIIHQRLLDALTKLGLEPIEAAGRPFDPNVHFAVQKEEREDAEDQTVLEELQRGYNFKNRLLRAAMVKVAVKP